MTIRFLGIYRRPGGRLTARRAHARRGFFVLLLSGVFCVLILSACEVPYMKPLTQANQSQWQIVVPESPLPAESKAAGEMRKNIRVICGADVEIARDNQPEKPFEILVGRNARLKGLGVAVDFAALGEDGFAIQTAGSKLIIAGGTGKGALYGVYTFLEDYLGCRMYSSTVTRIPHSDGISFPEINTTQVPVIRFRDNFHRDAEDPAYTDWHRLHHGATGEKSDWGLWVHTFHRLVPPDTYFKDHPEYYSLVGGQRVSGAQLCLTNPDVLRILVENLRKEMEAKPWAHYWSVSQNDTLGNCECPSCRAIDEREGTPMGSLLEFVNKVAAEFPDKTISTLAYQYSRSAPKNLRPARNVIIVLCSIECNRGKPIATDPSSASFRKDMEDWARVTDNVLVWDYVIQFSNLVSPFPNLRVLQPNLQYFVKNHCVAMFQQGNREIGGEFAELRAYLISKFLWNPDADFEAILRDFLEGYYGAAAPWIRKYIDTMHDALEASGEPLNIFGNPASPRPAYLSRDLMARYNEFFDAAEKAVVAQPETLDRVRFARLPVTYAMLEQAKQTPTGEGGMFRLRPDGTREVRPEILAKLEEFTTLCNRQGVTRVTEWHTTPDEYRENYKRLLERSAQSHLALGKPVSLNIPCSPKYAAGRAEILTDGLRGSLDFACNWLGFEGTDMDAVVDLERLVRISKVSVDFLQNALSWIFLPVETRCLVSVDGMDFVEVGKAENTTSSRTTQPLVQAFEMAFEPVETRYVRVCAVSPKTCPDWHAGAGNKAWIFADEIVVQ